MRSDEEFNIIDGAMVTANDCKIFKSYMVIMNKLQLMTSDDLRSNDPIKLTMGQLISRIWRSIEDAAKV